MDAWVVFLLMVAGVAAGWWLGTCSEGAAWMLAAANLKAIRRDGTRFYVFHDDEWRRLHRQSRQESGHPEWRSVNASEG